MSRSPRTRPVPATPQYAVVWARRASASKSACCTIWHLTLVHISLVQGCYRDLHSDRSPSCILVAQTGDAAFPAWWLCGSVALPLWVGGACQFGVKRDPTTDSLIAARLDSFCVYNYIYSLQTYSIMDIQTRRYNQCHM
jgi:hypothetical protein